MMPAVRGKRIPLNMRVTWEFRKKMEDAAFASGRSLAGEVEYRLERSFWGQDNAPSPIERAANIKHHGNRYSADDPLNATPSAEQLAAWPTRGSNPRI